MPRAETPAKGTNRTFSFIGVTTSKSSIMQVFPKWMEVVGRPEVEIEGIDCRIHDDPAVYRSVVARIREREESVGGLVTTHKLDLLSATRDMFDYLDPYAQATGEISCISKQDGRLEGHAKDPITAGLAFEAIVPGGYFGGTGAEVLIFGAGGSSMATVLYLIGTQSPVDRPRRVTVVNRSPARLDSLREMVERQSAPVEMNYVLNSDPSVNDRIMGDLPDHSVVINATGMGKDIPGSPISDAGAFPLHGIAWEFNYRGDLLFLEQANRQKKGRDLKTEDGWVYFLHGWTQVVAQVLHVDMTPELFARLARSAEATTGRVPPEGPGSAAR